MLHASERRWKHACQATVCSCCGGTDAALPFITVLSHAGTSVKVCGDGKICVTSAVGRKDGSSGSVVWSVAGKLRLDLVDFEEPLSGSLHLGGLRDGLGSEKVEL